MKIISKDPYITEMFNQRVLIPFKICKCDPLPLINDYTFHMGYNPYPEHKPYAYVMHDKKECVLPCYNYMLLGKKDRFLISDLELAMHEVFHIGHTKKLGDDKAKWQDFSEKTGHVYDLTWKPGVQIPSHECFAKDGQLFYKYNLDDNYYFDLFGMEKTEHYSIMRALTILGNVGYMSKEVAEAKRQAVIKQYI